MSSDTPVDAEYPYSTKPPAVLRPADFSASPIQRSSGRFIWVWFLRLAFAAGVIVAMIALPVGIVAYRARGQAAMVETLEERGCHVNYSYDPENDGVVNFLEESFGKKYFGEISEVRAIGLTSPNDAAVVCDICRKLDRLEVFEIASDSFSFQEIASWKNLDRLTVLRLRSPNISDDDLARIGRMPRLRILSVASHRITDAGLNHLSGLSQLGILEIDSARLSGGGPSNPKGFPELGTLVILNSPKTSDAAVLSLGPLPSLLALNLSETQIGDAAVAHVASGGKISNASLAQTRITDAALESLSKCADLFSLDVDDTQITDQGVAYLANCSGLSMLNLAGTNVTGKGFGVLSGNDLTLSLDRTAITADGLRDVLKMQGLTKLSLQEIKVTVAVARVLGEGTAVQSVDLSGAVFIGEGMECLSIAKIPDLNFSRTEIDDKALLSFVENDIVTFLNVSETKVTAAGVRAFYEARKQRLAKTGRQESLYVASDFEGVAETYLPDGMSGMLATEGDTVADPVEGDQPQQPPPPAESPN